MKPTPAERLEYAKVVAKLGCVEVTRRCKAFDARPSGNSQEGWQRVEGECLVVASGGPFACEAVVGSQRTLVQDAVTYLKSTGIQHETLTVYMLAAAPTAAPAEAFGKSDLGEAGASGPETPSVEADFGVLNRFCRHAFEIEDGYGDPDSNPKNFKVFRDGFFASYLMCGGNVENAVTWEISANCWREAFEEIYEFEVGQWEEVEAHARAALSTTPSPQREEGESIPLQQKGQGVDAVPDGFVLVHGDVVRFLSGQQAAPNGLWFGDASNGKRYWWRAMLPYVAPPVQPAHDKGEGK